MKKEKVRAFDKIKIPIWKIEEFRDILKMAIPIFIQLIFNVIITQINIIAINWYMNGVYSEAVSKAVLTYNTLQFIPSLIASGTIIVSGNLIGQGRKEEISRVVVSGLLINLLITSTIVTITEIFAEPIVKLMNAHDTPIIGTDVKSELDFVKNYYRLLNIQLIIMSVGQVFIASLQSVKKSTHVTIGAVISNIIDAIFVVMLLFVFKINPLWSALSISSAALLQFIYMMLMSFKFIDYKINKGKQFSKKFMGETIKTGLPITMEMGIWFLCNFAASTAISHLVESKNKYNEWIVLHRTVNSISLYASVFTQALGTVTAVFVSRRIGEKNIQKAYETGIDCWKMALYASLISSSFMLILSFPLLLAFNTPMHLIKPWGLSLFGLIFVKQILDTVNMTLLRALWATGDLWYPLIVSIFCMGLGMVAIPFTIIYGFKIYEGTGLILIYLGFILDPLLRSINYIIRWMSGKWKKYIMIVN